MSRKITQETFDSAVRENMDMFEMSVEDAVQEAVNQFATQDVNLDNIIKDLQISEGTNKYEALTEKITTLNQLISNNKFDDESIAILEFITAECKKDISYRLVCGKQGLYASLLKLTALAPLKTKIACLTTLAALSNGQPDLLDQHGVCLMMKLLHNSDEQILRFTLKWITNCCIKHERNRQKIFKAGVTTHLKYMLEDKTSNSVETIKEACAVCRALVLDDDIRVEFGQAHEHARAIASNTLCSLMKLLEAYKKNESVVGDLMLTLSAILVRAEYCKQVQESGGVEFINEALLTFVTKEVIVRRGLKLFKTLAGNDDCKYYIISKGAAPVIAACIDKHKSNETVVAVGLSCIAALSLRAPENSEELYRIGVADLIVDCIKIHPNNSTVQKFASWAIRNMVSRNKEQSKYFISIGAEQELNKALQKFAKECEFDIKSALRDMGCNVELREEWTGKGGKLQTDEGHYREFNNV